MGGVARQRRAARLGRPHAPGSSRSAGRCGPRATWLGGASSHAAAGAVGSKGLKPHRGHDTIHPAGAGKLKGRAHCGLRTAAMQAAGGRPRRAAGAGGRAPGLHRLGGLTPSAPSFHLKPRAARAGAPRALAGSKATPTPVKLLAPDRRRRCPRSRSAKKKDSTRPATPVDSRAATPRWARQAGPRGMRGITAWHSG